MPGLECVLLRDGELAGAAYDFWMSHAARAMPFLAHLGPKHAIDGDRAALRRSAGGGGNNSPARMGLEARVYGGMSPEQKLAIVRRLTAQAAHACTWAMASMMRLR